MWPLNSPVSPQYSSGNWEGLYLQTELGVRSSLRQDCLFLRQKQVFWYQLIDKPQSVVRLRTPGKCLAGPVLHRVAPPYSARLVQPAKEWPRHSSLFTPALRCLGASHLTVGPSKPGVPIALSACGLCPHLSPQTQGRSFFHLVTCSCCLWVFVF